MNALYEPFIERDLARIPEAIRQFRQSHSSDELFVAVARFALLSYAPSQHAKHALLACLSAYDLRSELGERFDDVVTECAIYAASSRLPWSEPPIMDPPAIAPDQRGDLDELLQAMRALDRHRGERWLACREADDAVAGDLFTVASFDFTDLGHKLIMALAASRLVPILGDQGRYATLRAAVWEMTAYAGEEETREAGEPWSCEQLLARLIDEAVREEGSPVSMHMVFLLDAALQASVLARDESILARTLDHLSGLVNQGAGSESLRDETAVDPPATIPAYRLARDYGACLKAFAVARRLRDRFPRLPIERLVASACRNLQHGPSFEEWSFA